MPIENREKKMSNFWDLMWLMVSFFFFVAYLLIMFQIVTDLFRDSELGGVAKALWLVALVFLPVATALVYVITRGRGMANRQVASAKQAKSEADNYIRSVAGKSPAEQIADAKGLLDSGVINADEYAKLKAKALA
jgi:uncharacterized membrane protein YcjF (UPF0283 family)